MSLTCAPWIDPDDVLLCTEADFSPPEIFPLIVETASDMLFTTSGRQFPGVCSDTVRPGASTTVPGTGSGWSEWRDYSWAGASVLADGSVFVPWLSDLGGAPISCGPACSGHRVALLPGYPVVDVQRITTDGVDLPDGAGLDPKAWVIIDDRWVARSDGGHWPCRQRLDRLDGEPGTWAIEYTWGEAVPAGGLLALQVLACELGKSFAGDKSCRLPKRLQSITREGLTAVVLDPFQFLDKGRFGIYEIDTWLNSVNPDNLSRDGKVISPATLAAMAHRVR